MYKNKDAVWVKVPKCPVWWPGEVVVEESPKRLPPLSSKRKRPPIARVIFNSDNTFADITLPTRIKPFNCPERDDFIESGRKIGTSPEGAVLQVQFYNDLDYLRHAQDPDEPPILSPHVDEVDEPPPLSPFTEDEAIITCIKVKAAAEEKKQGNSASEDRPCNASAENLQDRVCDLDSDELLSVPTSCTDGATVAAVPRKTFDPNVDPDDESDSEIYMSEVGNGITLKIRRVTPERSLLPSSLILKNQVTEQNEICDVVADANSLSKKIDQVGQNVDSEQEPELTLTESESDRQNTRAYSAECETVFVCAPSKGCPETSETSDDSSVPLNEQSTEVFSDRPTAVDCEGVQECSANLSPSLPADTNEEVVEKEQSDKSLTTMTDSGCKKCCAERKAPSKRNRKDSNRNKLAPKARSRSTQAAQDDKEASSTRRSTRVTALPFRLEVGAGQKRNTKDPASRGEKILVDESAMKLKEGVVKVDKKIEKKSREVLKKESVSCEKTNGALKVKEAKPKKTESVRTRKRAESMPNSDSKPKVLPKRPEVADKLSSRNVSKNQKLVSNNVSGLKDSANAMSVRKGSKSKVKSRTAEELKSFPKISKLKRAPKKNATSTTSVLDDSNELDSVANELLNNILLNGNDASDVNEAKKTTKSLDELLLELKTPSKKFNDAKYKSFRSTRLSSVVDDESPCQLKKSRSRTPSLSDAKIEQSCSEVARSRTPSADSKVDSIHVRSKSVKKTNDSRKRKNSVPNEPKSKAAKVETGAHIKTSETKDKATCDSSETCDPALNDRAVDKLKVPDDQMKENSPADKNSASIEQSALKSLRKRKQNSKNLQGKKNSKPNKKSQSSAYDDLLQDLEVSSNCLGLLTTNVPEESCSEPLKMEPDGDPIEENRNTKTKSPMCDPNLDMSVDEAEDNTDTENDDDDAELPEAFSSPTKGSLKINKGDFVWYRFKQYPFWPCVVRFIYRKKKNIESLSLLFVGDSFEKSQKGMKVRFNSKLLKYYSCPERQTLIEEGRSHGPSFTEAVKSVEAYLTKKGLGLTNQDSLDYFAVKEEVYEDVAMECDEPTETPPLPAPKPVDDDSEDNEESDDEDMDAGAKLPEKLLKKVNERKERRKQRNQILVDFIKSTEMRDYLQKLFHGKIKSEKHKQFHTDPQESTEAGFGPVDDDEQMNVITEKLIEYYKEVTKESHITVITINYIMNVWVPEAIVYAIKKKFNLHGKAAWDKFEKGVRWTIADHQCAHLTMLNVNEEAKKIGAMNIEAKAKRLLNSS